MLLITGSRGQLGTVLRGMLPQALHAGSEELNITDGQMVQEYVHRNNVDIIINCAAYTAVDRAEDKPEKAKAVNAIGPGNLAKSGAAIIHISTDYVFDGTASTPYTEETPTNPVSVYGSTKLQGEREVLAHASTAVILRTSWLYSPYGTNFVKTMLRLGSEKEEIRVVSDQVGAPTSCFDLARAIVGILSGLNPAIKGIYHYSNSGVCSWYDFAVEIMRLAGLPCQVLPIQSSEYPTRAKRPEYSVLNTGKFTTTFGQSIPCWKESLKKCLQQC